MKRWIALLFCAVLLMTVACPVWAEDPTTTTTTETVETTTEPPVETTTDSTTTTTESTEPTTTTTAPTRYAVYLTIAYENGEILIRAKDANGQPVRNAPVKVAAGSEQFSGYTNDAGVATFAMAEEPAQIICSTEAFKGTILYYEAASASVILHTPTSAPTTVDPITTPTPTQKPSTSYITGTSVTWTTSDPLQGNVTVTEIVTSTSEVEEEEEEDLQPVPQKSALPNGWALALMIMGGVLLIVAAVVLCLFLFRAPRVPVEEEEAPAAVPAPAPVEEAAEKNEEAAEPTEETAEEAAEQPAEEESTPVDTAPKSVSLEDLFR